MSNKTFNFHSATLTQAAFQQDLAQRVQFSADVIRNTLRKLTIPQPFWYDWSWVYSQHFFGFSLVRFKEDYRDKPTYQDVTEDILQTGVVTDDVHLSFLTQPQYSIIHTPGAVRFSRHVVPLKYFLNDPVTVSQSIRLLARDFEPHRRKAEVLAKQQELRELQQKQQEELTTLQKELSALQNQPIVKPRRKV